MHRGIQWAVTGLIASLAFSASFAQDAAAGYPSRTISFVVPYAAGGSSDTRARQVATKMAVILGKSVIVENKPGAAGNIGTEYIARANPDGHVIGIGDFAPLSANKALFPKLGYEPSRDLVPVVLLEKGPLALLVSSKSSFRSVGDLVTWSKANAGQATHASAGPGGAFHLAGKLLEEATGTPMLHVPCKGGAPAANDLLAGNVTFSSHPQWVSFTWR